MRLYRYTGQLQFHGAVEADSLAEATRKIDDVLQNAGEVRIIETENDEELTASTGAISRSRIQVEN